MMRLLLITLLIPFVCMTQVPPSVWLEANSVRAHVTANGNLFMGGQQGGFLVPKASDDDPTRATLFRGVFPWLGAQDPFGNLYTAVAHPAWGVSPFKGGLINTPGYGNKIWKVTRADIEAHRADFMDNGVIDNPISAIMEWPGSVNVGWDVDLNGVSIEAPVHVAPFKDLNANGIYEPEKGEYPLHTYEYGLGFPFMPDEFVFLCYHDATVQSIPSSLPLLIQTYCVLSAYNCPEEPALHNTIFAEYTFWQAMEYRLDDVYLGLLLDFEIGYSQDDCIGSIPDFALFGYNGDSYDDNIFLNNPPLVAMVDLAFPKDTFGEPTQQTFMPIYYGQADGLPAIVTWPQGKIEIYRYLMGRFPDMTPLTASGRGYNPNLPLPPTRYAFPGNPFAAEGWSEPSAGNKPGNRRALVSYGPYTHKAGAMNNMFVAFHWARGDSPSPLSGYVPLMEHALWLKDQYEHQDVLPPGTTPGCLVPTNVASHPEAYPLEVYPNPASSLVWVRAGGMMPDVVRVFDVAGRLALMSSLSANGDGVWAFSVAGLRGGLYVLEVTDRLGRRFRAKILVTR